MRQNADIPCVISFIDLWVRGHRPLPRKYIFKPKTLQAFECGMDQIIEYSKMSYLDGSGRAQINSKILCLKGDKRDKSFVD